jgi:hypothetical protein
LQQTAASSVASGLIVTEGAAAELDVRPTRRVSAVEVVPFVVTYNGMATGPCVKRCAEYLMAGGPGTFGAAVERVELYPHCQTGDPVIAGLESMHDRFQTRLATLPFARFRRKARLFEVSFVSRWIRSEAMFGAAVAELPPAEFRLLCGEFVAALALLRSRVKRSDAFDTAGLEAHVQRRLDSLREQPCTGEMGKA